MKSHNHRSIFQAVNLKERFQWEQLKCFTSMSSMQWLPVTVLQLQNNTCSAMSSVVQKNTFLSCKITWSQLFFPAEHIVFSSSDQFLIFPWILLAQQQSNKLQDVAGLCHFYEHWRNKCGMGSDLCKFTCVSQLWLLFPCSSDALQESPCFSPYCCVPKWAVWVSCLCCSLPAHPCCINLSLRQAWKTESQEWSEEMCMSPHLPTWHHRAKTSTTLLQLRQRKEEKSEDSMAGGSGGIEEFGASGTCKFIS